MFHLTLDSTDKNLFNVIISSTWTGEESFFLLIEIDELWENKLIFLKIEAMSEREKPRERELGVVI